MNDMVGVSEPQKEPERSYLVIQFTGMGSAMFGMEAKNVTPMQLLLIGEYLSMKAKMDISRMENEKLQEMEENSLSKPTPKIVVPKRGHIE